MPESRLGCYRDLTRIAVGGNAEVFRARDERSGELVALKVLLPHTGEDLRDQVLREARLQESLRHPNLVAVREHGVTDGHAYLALEYVDGPSLAAVLAGRRLSPATAVHIARGVLAALAAVHGARDAAGAPLDIVHRDVTPQNIMFDREGRVKLGDFGIASSRGAARTRTGMIKGKLGYLAPEQVTQSRLDARTDLFQLALVLFEMLCGAPYFDGLSELELLRAAEAPVSKRASAHGAPPVLDAVLQRALQRFPEERYASADAFARDLAALAPELGQPDLSFATDTAGAPPVPALTGATSTSENPWRRRALVLTLGVAAVVAAVALRFSQQDAGRETVAPPLEPRASEPSAAPSEPSLPTVSSAADTPPPPSDVPRASPKKARAARVETAPPSTPTAAPVPDAPPPPSAERLQDCIGRLAQRDIAIVDLPPELRRELVQARAASPDGSATDQQALCAKLDAVTVDRALVERKLTRIQSRIGALAADDPRRPDLARLTRDTLQTFLDGNITRTNEKLREVDRLLAR